VIDAGAHEAAAATAGDFSKHQENSFWGLRERLDLYLFRPPHQLPREPVGAGPRVAALFYSLTEFAKLCGVEPRGYLREATLRAVRNPGTVTRAQPQVTQIPREIRA
jgi:hypothetical protein